jgi:antitoxin (DNA-binding transcriptional repressor) of toxin-antitoxin stability system
MGGEVIICRRNVPLAKVESMRKPAGGVQGARRIQNASEYLEEELVRLVGCMV